MQLDKLQIELRPRSHAQALDLGYALLRARPGPAIMAYAALWLPLIALCGGLTALFPGYGWAFMILAWWCRPLLERAPLYVLSRQVFGTEVSWTQALRAWPSQLGGGAWRLLTWGRPFAAGRALYQPMWMLERARGAVARERMRVLGRDGTGAAAYWFGIVMVHLDGVLQMGIVGLIGIFMSDGELSNPFAVYFTAQDGELWLELLGLGVYGLVGVFIGPLYTACGFTLYLNRRATLEAWDIEIKLRQMSAPVSARQRGALGQALCAGALAVLLSLTLTATPPAQATVAAPAAPESPCEVPKGRELPNRSDTHGERQTRIRRQVDQLYASEDLRGFDCSEVWRPKNPEKDKKEPKRKPVQLPLLATLIKIGLIGAALALVAWLLYRYRDKLPGFSARAKPVVATEVGGLDIRAESLPEKVTDTVRALWARGERRAALALLYRATLSRLVNEHSLPVRQGNTEGDCLQLARQAALQGRLSQGRLDVTSGATTLWLNGAYGNRWPDDAAVLASCAEWDAQFDTPFDSPPESAAP